MGGNGMPRLFRIFISLWIIALSPPGFADTLVPVDVYGESSRYILDGRYDDAERLLKGFIAEYPEEPAGYILKAAVLHYRAIDSEDYSRGEEYRALLDRAESYARKKCSSDGSDLWARFFAGSSRSLRGAWDVSEGSFISGMVNGRAGANGMSQILAADPRFYDAMIADGSYRFWKSAAVRNIRLTAFIGDECAKGIAEVRKGIERGKLTGPLSRTVLLEMLLAYDPATAAKEGKELVRLYPSCRLFLWQLGEAYKKLERYDAAVEVFSSLAQLYAEDTSDDGSGQVRCWWKLAVLARSLGKTDECGKYCELILGFSDREPVRIRQKKRIERARKMSAEMNHERH